MKLNVNGKIHQIDVDPSMPLLWVLRDELDIKGPKFGCGIAMCGACTVHINGTAVRSCVYPVSAVNGDVTTIEGLVEDLVEGLGTPDTLHAVQQAWIEHQVAQCGYCQSGQIMSAAALLKKTPQPNDDDIDTAMSGNLCRCGTYPRIRAAIKTAAASLSSTPKNNESSDKNLDNEAES